MRRIVVIGVIATCLVVGLGTVALAHTFRAASSVTIDQHSHNVAKGHVASRKVSCTRNRRVDVRHAGSRKLYGFDRTDENGEWRVDADFNSNYYAIVRKRVFSRGSHRHVCRADRSPLVVIP